MKEANEDAEAEEESPLLAFGAITEEESSPSLAFGAIATIAQRRSGAVEKTMTPKPSSRTWWDNFKDEAWVHDQYPELNAEQVGKATRKLELVIYRGHDADERVYRDCVYFKSRAMKSCTLLHFAIWVVAQAESKNDELVEKLLKRMEDPDMIFSPAILPAGREPPKVTILYASHIAAGLGLLNELQCLTDFASTKTSDEKRMSPEEYLNTWACTAEEAVTKQPVVRDKDLTNAYQAIHEATFQGHADVTLYLMRNGCDRTSQNADSITPLHFVSLIGISEDLPGNVVPKITTLVQEMVVDNEALEAHADMSKLFKTQNSTKPGDARHKNMIPLEVAVQSASRFPQECVGLLAPCLVNYESYLEDIRKIAVVTHVGALNLVRTIAELGRKDPHILKCFRASAQQLGTSDVLGSIFYTAPQAASEMLELLEIEPIVQDSAHYPVPSYVSLWGWFTTLPMRCSYQVDVRCSGKLRIPSWEYRKYAEGGQVRKDSWQLKFMPIVHHHARKAHIKKVKVVAYLLPGLLDIDIIMALAQLQKHHSSVMNTRAVQGVVECLWENLVSERWKFNIVCMFYDLLALMTLAFFHKHDEVTSHITLSLAAIFGNVVRSLVEFLSLLFSLLRKNGTMGDDPHLANMWSPSSSWFLSSFVAPLLSTLMHLVFLHLVGFDVAGIKNQAHANQFLEKIVFSSCLLISSLQFVVMWRFSTIGATIYTVRKTVTSGAVNQTLFIFGLIFISVTLILLVWKEDSDSILILAAFRGWLFADGDGFNAMGFNKGLTTQVVFCMAAAFFFNVMTLNIIIAVYGHEYDKAQENLKFMFMKGRAHYCASSILSSYLFPWRGALLNYTLKFCAWLLIISSFCLSIYLRSVIIAGLLLGLGQRLYAMSLMQCDWFSPEGDDVDHHQRFLWVCYPEDWASWMSPDDYAGGSSGGNDSDREPAWVGERITSASSLSAIKDAENMESKLAALRQEMDKLMDAMEAQVRNQ